MPAIIIKTRKGSEKRYWSGRMWVTNMFAAHTYGTPEEAATASREIRRLRRDDWHRADGWRLAVEDFCPHCNGYGSSLKESSDRCSMCGGSGLAEISS